MRAKIVPNLMDVIDDFFDKKEGHRDDPVFIELCNRIKGKTVELVFIGGDAFEAEDRNYWLPEVCYTEVKS
jgi:hypothetical protein